jgi:hypothetical protein
MRQLKVSSLKTLSPKPFDAYRKAFFWKKHNGVPFMD